MRVVAMFRVSTEVQATDGASLDAQERRYAELAAANRWRTVATFRGCESASQASSDRKVLQEVLGCLRREKPDAIYVHEQSRLTRGDELEVAGLFRELREQHVKVIISGVVRDLGSIDERFMLGIQSLVDRAEVERFRERVRRGKREKGRKGLKNCGPSPYGYRNPPTGTPERGRLEIVEEQAVTVRRIFQMAAAGSSPKVIAETLTAQGELGPRGAHWATTTVKRMLANPVYIGRSITGGWVAETGSRTFRFKPDNADAIVVENAHPSIISPELWAAVQSRPRAPRTQRPRLLTGLLHVEGVRYCGDVDHARACYRPAIRGSRGRYLNGPEVDEAVWTAFEKLARQPEEVAKIAAAATGTDHRQDWEAELEQAQRQRQRLEARRGRLIDMRADGEIDTATYRTKSVEIADQIKATSEQVSRLRAQLATSDPDQMVRAVGAIRTMLRGRRQLTQDQQRKLLHSVVRRVDVALVDDQKPQRRDGHGRYRSTTYTPRWRVEKVRFSLPLDAASRTGNMDQASGCCADRRRR